MSSRICTNLAGFGVAAVDGDEFLSRPFATKLFVFTELLKQC